MARMTHRERVLAAVDRQDFLPFRALFIQDIEGRRRRATLCDFDNIAKLCEHSRNVKLVGSIPVEPGDLPELFKPARLVHHLMRHSNKPTNV